jgi:hypothetical protein
MGVKKVHDVFNKLFLEKVDAIREPSLRIVF